MRQDVRRMLLARGWAQDDEFILRKDGALWTETNGCRASGLDGVGYTIEFAGSVPARVIVAACEAAAIPIPTRRSA
ncbi:hypothetical protein ACFY97_18500 [Streptomyces klenkii]|uniref:hypothetical protein n=1 Tax=Streptomyces klenkii TaxID=1420899 RepID=UPI0036E6997E